MRALTAEEFQQAKTAADRAMSRLADFPGGEEVPLCQLVAGFGRWKRASKALPERSGVATVVFQNPDTDEWAVAVVPDGVGAAIHGGANHLVGAMRVMPVGTFMKVWEWVLDHPSLPQTTPHWFLDRLQKRPQDAFVAQFGIEADTYRKIEAQVRAFVTLTDIDVERKVRHQFGDEISKPAVKRIVDAILAEQDKVLVYANTLRCVHDSEDLFLELRSLMESYIEDAHHADVRGRRLPDFEWPHTPNPGEPGGIKIPGTPLA